MPYTLAVYMVTDFLGGSASPAKVSRLTGFLVLAPEIVLQHSVISQLCH